MNSVTAFSCCSAVEDEMKLSCRKIIIQLFWYDLSSLYLMQGVVVTVCGKTSVDPLRIVF